MPLIHPKRTYSGWRKALCAAVLCSSPIISTSALAALAPLEAGIAAYREGDVSEALDLFLQAQGGGESSDTLTFNLGLAHYRLGHYALARESFASLLVSPEFAVAAEYHLGLIAARNGNLKNAIAHLRAVDDDDNTPEMRSMAQLAIERITASTQTQRASGRVTMAAGYDSNPAQQPETETIGERYSEDSLAQVVASLSYPLGTLLNPVAELHGNAYVRDYVADNFFDQYGADLGLRRPWQLGVWNGAVGFAGSTAFLNNEYFQSTSGLNAEAIYQASQSTLTLRLRTENISSAAAYAYLDGWRHRLEVNQSVTLGRVLLGATFESELNHRRDLVIGDQFFSQSPLRNTVTARLSHAVAGRLSLDWQARYRRSRYSEPHRLTLNDTVAELLRTDDFTQFGVAARFRSSRSLGYVFDYRYNDNVSSLGRYDYDRHAMLLAVDWKY